MASKEHIWLTKYLKPLEGRTIVKTRVNMEGFPVLVLDDKTSIEVSRDEEGNGPGWLFGLPNPTNKG